jgi:hypothetical protein
VAARHAPDATPKTTWKATVMLDQCDRPDGDYCEHNTYTQVSTWWLDSRPFNLREAMGYLMSSVGMQFAEAIAYLRSLQKWNTGMDSGE